MNNFRGEYGEFAAGILLFSEISPLDEVFLNNIHRCNLKHTDDRKANFSILQYGYKTE